MPQTPGEFYHYGNSRRFRVSCYDKDPADGGVLVDPATVTFKLMKPDGTVTTATFPTAPVVKEAVGIYSAVITLDQEGDWAWRWETMGTGAAADERAFHVINSMFYPPP